MATWGSYFSSYVKKKEEGTSIPVEAPEAAKAEPTVPRKVNAGVQRSNTTTKKLYGAAIEESSAEGIERSASNAARVAKLFGYKNQKSSLAQVVEDAVKQNRKPSSEPKDEPAVEKYKYIPITQSLTKSPVTEVPTQVNPQAVGEEKSQPGSNYISITSSLPKDSISEMVAKMSSQAIPAPKPEAKEESQSRPTLEATQHKTSASVSAKSLLPSLLQKSAKVTEPGVRPLALATREEYKDYFIPIVYSIPKEQATAPNTPSKSLIDDDIAVSPTDTRWFPLPRVDSMFSQPALSPSNSPSSSDNVMREPEMGAVKSVVEKEAVSSDRVLNRNNSPKHSAKLSLDKLMQTLQPGSEQPRAEQSPKTTERPQPAPKGRSPKQSVSDILDDIMATLQTEIAPVSMAKPIAAVVVQKPTRSPPAAITNITTELPTAVQRTRRSPSTTSIKVTPSPGVVEVLTEVPEPEEETVEIVESRAWEYARKLSEFKLQQELFEKERKRMVEDQRKFQEMEARFKEEREQQLLFVEEVRREQEREAAEELQRLRVERERLAAETAENTRLAEEAARMKREAEAALERMELEKRLREEAEKSRIAAEQEKNRLAWEEDKQRNAAEIARLIAEEEERERLEMAQLDLVPVRSDRVPPTPRMQPDLDEVSVYSDELVESDDDWGPSEEEQQRINEERRREEKGEDKLKMKDGRLGNQREDDDPVARRKKREEQDRREQMRYERLEAERIRAQEEEIAEEERRFEVEEEERIRREEAEERLRFELQQDDEQRRIDEKKAQKLQFQKEQDERMAYAAAEADRQRMEDEEAEVEARLAEGKRKAPQPMQNEQNFWAERRRLANQAAQAVQQQTSGKTTPRQGLSEEERRAKEIEAAAARQAEADEERRIEEIAARMQAEDEAAEAAETKAEELRKAEEKIKMAFASMAAQKSGGPPPVVPAKRDDVRVISRSATPSDRPPLPAKAAPRRLIGKMGPLPVKRPATVTSASSNTSPPAGVTRYYTVAGGPRDPEKSPAPVVARGNTVVGRTGGLPKGLPSGPKARIGLPSGPRPKRN